MQSLFKFEKMTVKTSSESLERLLNTYLRNISKLDEFPEDKWSNGIKQIQLEQVIDLVKTIKSESNWNVMHFAALRGHVKTIEVIRNAICSQRPEAWFEILSEKDRSEMTPLMHAAGKGSLVVESILCQLDANQRLDLVLQKDKDGNTALHYAVLSNTDKESCEVVRSLLKLLQPDEANQLLQIQGRSQKTAIHIASEAGYGTVIGFLRDAIKPPQWIDLLLQHDLNERTAVHYAASEGHKEAMRCMIGSLSSADAFTVLKLQDNRKATSLHIAASKGHTAVFKEILC